MPASGRGANVDVTRRITSVRKPAPVRKRTPAPSTINLRSTSLPTQPFKPAQQQAQKRVTQARSKLPKLPTPNIPRIPNPTPEQTHAALTIAHTVQQAALGPKPTAARVREYQQELRDPRQRAYVQTLQHYVAAAQRHAAMLPAEIAGAVGRQIASQGGIGGEPVSAGTAEGISRTLGQISRQQAINRGEGTLPSRDVGIKIPGAGTINLTGLSTAIAKAHLLKGLPLGHIIEEGIDLPAQTFLSSAIAGSALHSAIQGKPAAAEDLGKGVLNQVEHPIRSLREQPLATALTLAGGEAAAGSLLGKVARAGALGDRAAELASTVRPDLKLYGERPTAGPVEESGIAPAPQEGLRISGRRYNPDPLRKAVQVAGDKGLTKLPGSLRQADPLQAEGWRLRRNVAGGYIKVGAVDRVATAAERTRRQFVKGTIAKVANLKPERGEDAVPLIVQGIVRTPATLEHDLGHELTKLREAAPGLSRAQKGANAANQSRVQALLDDREFMAHPDEAFAAAKRYRQIQGPLEAILVHGGKLAPEQLRSKLFPYAQAHMGAVHDGVALRDADGRALTNEQIKDHMAENGVEDVGFISHKSGTGGSGDFYQSVDRFPRIERHKRTGAAFAKGITDHSWEALNGSIARQASEGAQLEAKARSINRLALVPREGGFASKDAAQKYIRENGPLPGEPPHGLGELVAHHLGADPYLHNIDPAAVEDTLAQFGLHEHQSALAKQNGKYGVIPRDVQERLTAHEGATSAKNNAQRALQAYQQGFRRAKLNTSTRHIAGVVQEQGIRLLFEGVAPGVGRAARTGRSYRRSIEHLAEIDHGGQLADDAGPLGSRYRELEGAGGQRGGQVDAQKQLDIVRKGRAWSGDSIPAKIAIGAEGAAHSRVGRSILAPWHAWQKVVEGSLVKVEHATHDALVGKALKETGFIDSYRQALKLQDEGMQALIKGGLTPNKADAIARAVDETMGNWTHLTPTVRKVVANYAPFGLWWLNSMRWLYRLPVTHPIKTGILSALYAATKSTRNAEGQGFGASSPVPAFLQGTIKAKLPIVGEVPIAPSYYSPGGTLGPELYNTAVEQFVPQLTGPVAAAQGVNPLTHEPLKGERGEDLRPVPQGLNVLGEILSGPLPGATQAQGLLQQGGKPKGTANILTDIASKLGGPSQVKPGSEIPFAEELFKLISPVRFTRSKTTAGGLDESSSAPAPTDAMSARRRLARRGKAPSASALMAARRRAATRAR